MDLKYQILIALALDLLLGDPRSLPHPVKLIGALAAWLEAPARQRFQPRTAGILTAAAVILAAAAAAGAVIFLAGMVHPFLKDAACILILYTTFAARDLARHSSDVYQALARGDLPEARRCVSRMVGRDTEQLDEQGVTRAAVESVAENTVDGVIAPLFFAFLAGPVGAIAYKAVNTLDSTFGYRNERYAEFGWASARIDDAANYIPARLAVPLIAAASVFLDQDARGALRISRRDGRKHASPNSGLSEAAMAGALGVRLGGPVMRKGKPDDMPCIGDPAHPLQPGHIRRANSLMFAATLLFAAFGTAVEVLLR
jgi:adenosylcobinamide-phosphate synthase